MLACNTPQPLSPFAGVSALTTEHLSISYDPQIDSVVFEMTVEDDAGSVAPRQSDKSAAYIEVDASAPPCLSAGANDEFA